MKTNLVASGMDPDMAEQVLDTVSEAPDTYSDIYVYSFFMYDKVIDDIEVGSHFQVFPELWDTGDYCLGNTLYMTPEVNIATYFHESGHAVDYVYTYDDYDTTSPDETEKKEADAAWYVRSYEWYVEMERDVRWLIEAQATSSAHPILASKWNGLTAEQQELIYRSIIASDAGYPVAYDADTDAWTIVPVELSDDLLKIRTDIVSHIQAVSLSDDLVNAYMVYDCVEGMTNARATFRDTEDLTALDYIWLKSQEYGLAGGHFSSSSTYWFDEDGNPTMNQPSEAWAEYYSSVMLGDVDALNSNRYYFSNTCEYFDNVLSVELRDYYKNLVMAA